MSEKITNRKTALLVGGGIATLALGTAAVVGAEAIGIDVIPGFDIPHQTTQGGEPTVIPGVQTETPTVTPTPTGTPAATLDGSGPVTAVVPQTAFPTQPETATPSVSSTVEQLKNINIEVDLSGLAPEWPKTPEDAAKLLKLDPSYAKNLVPVIWTNTDTGAATWSGEWMGEMWPLQNGVTYDIDRGMHMDTNGQPLTDIQKIFDFSQRPTLVDVKLDSNFAALYAGRGTETNNGLPQDTGYFAGTKGAEIQQIEQLTILRPEFDLGCNRSDFATAANLRAFRQSAREFRDNKAAQDGKRQIVWFNPETNTFETVQGQLIAEMAKQGIDMPFIDKMPAGYPLTGKQVASRLGGQESQWVFDPTSGDWNYEAWDLIPGVHYVDGVGHFDSQNRILVGSDRVNSQSPLDIFAFNQAVNPQLMFSSMKGPGNIPSSLWVRVGGDDTGTKHPQSLYTYGNGDITVDPNASMLPMAEQAKLVIVDQNACAPLESIDLINRFIFGLAESEKANHPGFIVKAWNGSNQTFQDIIR